METKMSPFLLSTALVLTLCVQPVPAPVPRCSPMIIINKLAESSNILSDSNPYFPVPPCEYGGWAEALQEGDLRSIFVFAEPHKIPLHNFYEFIWLLKTGGPRMLRLLTGQEKFVFNRNILNEGYRHSTPHVRTKQLGQHTYRNPIIIDDKKLYKNIVGGKIKSLITQGPDKHINKHYTYQGGPRGRRPGGSSGYGAPSTGSGYGAPNTNSGYGAPSTSSGYGAPSTSSGYGAPSTNSGYGAPSTNSGYGAPSTNSGYGAPSTSSGYGAPSTSSGYAAPSTGSGYAAPSTGSAYNAPSPGGSYSAPAVSSGYNAPAVSSGYSAPATSSGYAAPQSSNSYTAPQSSSSYTAPSTSSQTISSYDAPVVSNYQASEIITANVDGTATYDVNAADISTSYSANNPFLRSKKSIPAKTPEVAEEEDTFQPSEEWPRKVAEANEILRTARETDTQVDHASVLTNGDDTFFSGIVSAGEASSRQGRQAVAEDASGSLATVAKSGDGSAAFVSGFVPSDSGNPYFAAQRRQGVFASRPRGGKSFYQKLKDFFTRRS